VRTLLLTIVGPERTSDLAVSGDLPVTDLMPSLLEAALITAGGAVTDPWVLSLPGGEPLALDRSLTESGVVDGQRLLLRPRSDRPDDAQRVVPRSDPPVAGSPFARGRRALPSQATRRERLARRDRYIVDLDRLIEAPRLPRRCVTIAVVSSKGGVGKSTISVLLATLLARLRNDSVTVIDADSDYGSLGRWLAPDHPVSVNELAAELEQPGYLAGDLDDHLALGPEGLRLCPAPRDPRGMAALDCERYGLLLARLQDQPGILILDCGTGLGQPGVQAAILASDQLVLVSDAEPATLTQVADAADLLRHTGNPITVVINRTRRTAGSAPNADALFPCASALLRLSNEAPSARLLSSNRFSWDAAPRSWHRETRELAAILTAQWTQLSRGESDLPRASS
jgi:MinD-like ATPase involved in chromosome partitioning or flagellar assembly